MEELPLDHEPSLDHWAKCIANDDVATDIGVGGDAGHDSLEEQGGFIGE